MLHNYVCGGEIADGHLVIKEPLAFQAAMRRMKTGPVLVKVGARERQRTLDQNAFLHAVPLPLLAEHFGDSIEATKLALMGEYWGWVPSKLDPARMVPIKPSTASMSVEEFSKFLDWLLPWAATEHGVLIPLPNEAL